MLDYSGEFKADYYFLFVNTALVLSLLRFEMILALSFSFSSLGGDLFALDWNSETELCSVIAGNSLSTEYFYSIFSAFALKLSGLFDFFFVETYNFMRSCSSFYF